MAGMLPGVECARRRRFPQSSNSPGMAAHGGTRRSSFCLYTSNHEPNRTSVSSMRSTLNQTHQDQKLGGAAREAKERLDEKLRTHRESNSKRYSFFQNHQSKERSKRCGNGILGEMHTEVVGSKQGSVLAKLMSWKASEQECAVCLERFRAGQTLLHLPCAHRFHATCLVPWLESNAHCPYCRMGVLS